MGGARSDGELDLGFLAQRLSMASRGRELTLDLNKD